MRIVSDETKISAPNAKSSQAVDKEGQVPFAAVLNESMQTPKTKSVERRDEIGNIMRYAQHTEGYAEGVMNSYMADFGGALIDITDPEAICFSVSGELVTKEAMIYFQELNAIAKQGYAKINQEAQAMEETTEGTFKRFLEFNSSLPERYKQMANILY
ncbi:hypothetical protein [Pseudomonas sp. BP8]|uniref:hypothetical protein n=1 Tax=Pseudomonas sp. BP8 TaxID=2817864 RepID=UPI001AE6E216|nr:hypothetical protein [Pseudomonas sp. BP8]MBP2260409.1 hypothetical protein [Pseudomonas sp. BP8]HDS1737777.1 hypothetical protein [Pseudomonas putida]